MRSNETSTQSTTLRTLLADVARKPVSQQAVRRSRLAAGAVAVAGSAVALMGWSHGAEAKALDANGNHAIKTGESLGTIAEQHGVSVEALAKANNISVDSVIFSGHALKIPTSGTDRSKSTAASFGSYTVKHGDTLSGIASAHGVSVATIASTNGISTKKVLSIGKVLSIPGVSDTSPIASSAPKTASGKSGLTPNDITSSDSRWALKAQFNKAASTYGVSVGVLEAMTWNESGWQNSAQSNVGAKGIGQIMPSTADHINEMTGTHLDPSNTSDNIKMSAIYLKYLLNANNGDYEMALASYYQGLASVKSIGLYDDTKQYVRTIEALQANYFS